MERVRPRRRRDDDAVAHPSVTVRSTQLDVRAGGLREYSVRCSAKIHKATCRGGRIEKARRPRSAARAQRPRARWMRRNRGGKSQWASVPELGEIATASTITLADCCGRCRRGSTRACSDLILPATRAQKMKEMFSDERPHTVWQISDKCRLQFFNGSALLPDSQRS